MTHCILNFIWFYGIVFQVSVANAFDMMLTGKNIKPDKAKKMGLVDAVVDPVGKKTFSANKP